jgi:hypothetical protein
MLINLDLSVDDRMRIMLFRLFDRRNQGWFNYAEFSDIVDGRLKPNFCVMIRDERRRWKLDGVNIRFSKRKAAEKVIEFRERVVEKEIIQEKYVEIVKEIRVPKEVIKEVEKPIYVEKEVTKEVLIEEPPQVFYRDGTPAYESAGYAQQQRVIQVSAPPQVV